MRGCRGRQPRASKDTFVVFGSETAKNGKIAEEKSSHELSAEPVA